MATNKTTTDHHNPDCPDFGSHEQNAADAWIERNRREPAARADWDEIDAAADDEYRACEGHGR